MSSRQNVGRTNKAPIAGPSLVAQPDRRTSLTSFLLPQHNQSEKALNDTLHSACSSDPWKYISPRPPRQNTANMTRGNQREKAREKNLAKDAATKKKNTTSGTEFARTKEAQAAIMREKQAKGRLST